MPKRIAITACISLGALAFCALAANAQIVKIADQTGRLQFINAEPPAQLKRPPAKSRATLYLPGESSLLGRSRPAMSIDREGAEKLVRETADRHRIDPALVRAVIETESNWNAGAISRKGAIGLMQLIPTTAIRLGVNDAFSPKQNIDAGTRYLKRLLERYNGSLDLALAAYNAGEGAVDRARGIPAFRETRNYVQKVQDAYFRPGSGRSSELWVNPRAIRKDVDSNGRAIFTNQ
jgi:soluble lytic murein transglycosylase-like protein